MGKGLQLNPGAQTDFVYNPYRASAYIGGLGSGKTYGMIARGLLLSTQPKVGFWGPRGCFAAINYPVLKDVVLPLFHELMDGSGLLLDYIKSEKKALLVPYNDQGVPDRTLVKRNGEGACEILFRSLDQPNWMRGLELSWYGIDEGRHLTTEAWNVLYGRLRQKGYTHQGFVCSTPNGYDWMWDKFHPKSPHRIVDSHWYNAPTFENKRNLPQAYIESLMATYSGRFLRQEVYGEFVGTVDGAVFFEWDPAQYVDPALDYDPELPLYSFWDFGMGDLGVVVFAQVGWQRVNTDIGQADVPFLYIIDCLESTDRTSEQWAWEFKQFIASRFNGRPPDLNVCDPAGRQRSVSSGKSIIQDLDAYGVRVIPAPKRPVDYAIRILNNMMAGGRVLCSPQAERVTAAFASHKWNVDPSGTKIGSLPVHDWTSHFCDAVRYGATTLLNMSPRRVKPTGKEGYRPDQYGFITNQLLKEPEYDDLTGETNDDIEWEPALLG